jgi:hypothetical protein
MVLGPYARCSRQSPLQQRFLRTQRMETGVPAPFGTRHAPARKDRVCDGRAPDMRGRSQETGFPARFSDRHTSGSPRRRPPLLPVRSVLQPPRCKFRNRAVISSHDSADCGRAARFSRRRSISSSCQGCTGTSSGRLETSSQRSSTNWSLSAALSVKREEVSGGIATSPRNMILGT